MGFVLMKAENYANLFFERPRLHLQVSMKDRQQYVAFSWISFQLESK
jgi:hypothetical protein